MTHFELTRRLRGSKHDKSRTEYHCHDIVIIIPIIIQSSDIRVRCIN